ncbi:hypothetical protein ACHAWF_001195 [Thalassiosira exigua]
MASALCVCEMVLMEARYWAFRKLLRNKLLQKQLIKPNSCNDPKWPLQYNSTGTLHNQTTREWEAKSPEELLLAI